MDGFQIQLLGQAGCRLQFLDTVIYIDPYLSNSVAELESPGYKRLKPISLWPRDVSDADFVFISHEHIDHCDPHTLPEIFESSPKVKFIGPSPVIQRLINWGIPRTSILNASFSEWKTITSDLKWRSIPAAHPHIQKDSDGQDCFVGYLFDWCGHRVYHSGDTSLNEEIFRAITAFKPIQTVLLPVNERNFFKEQRGIIGNLTLREALLFAEAVEADNFVPVHWDMFAANSVGVEEIKCTFELLKPPFNLLLNPRFISKRRVEVSIVIRTLNESRYLGSLLAAIAAQDESSPTYEIILVDSGSTDATLDIAAAHGCRVLHINRSEFSFGRSLNIGCEAAIGQVLVMISGHCVPTDRFWLKNLCRPLFEGHAQYAYGKQMGGDASAPSECAIFQKYFPDTSQVPQSDYFCNNANSALLRTTWAEHRFDESLTGLEDMDLAKRLVEAGGCVGYIADAAVFHYHHESPNQVRRRFEREALALQFIMPQVQLRLVDVVWFFLSGVLTDFIRLKEMKRLNFSSLSSVLIYRLNQYWGSYIGNHSHRRLSQKDKLRFFFPTSTQKN